MLASGVKVSPHTHPSAGWSEKDSRQLRVLVCKIGAMSSSKKNAVGVVSRAFNMVYERNNIPVPW
jgi:hypothetical protein